jgi:hypothetical protein
VQLNERPRGLGNISHAALYVALTRVKDPADIRLFQPTVSAPLHYVLKLRPMKGVETWLTANSLEKERKREGGNGKLRISDIQSRTMQKICLGKISVRKISSGRSEVRRGCGGEKAVMCHQHRILHT